MEWIEKFNAKASGIISGKSERTKLALSCLLAGGHLLIEDIPGVGKTTLVKFLSKVLGLDLSRIQFTNDLLPSDILGVNTYNPNLNEFTFHKGPIFGEVILADELNRATPKTQSALLQVMEEYKLTMDGHTYEMPKPFFVIATQNPRTQIGTNPLPESQLDRFLMKLDMGVPSRGDEKKLLTGKKRVELIDKLEAITSKEEIFAAQKAVNEMKVSDAIIEYVLDILEKSRLDHDYQALSPRAGLDLIQAAKSYCLLSGKSFVEPEDVQSVISPVIGHRIVNSLESSTSIENEVVTKLVREIHVY